MALAYWCTLPLLRTYEQFPTGTVLDRSYAPILVQQNAKEQYTIQLESYPTVLQELVIQKEDRFFPVHPGVNPFSILRAVARGIGGDGFGGSSTITQQLIKILDNQERARTFVNKVKEMVLAVALEVRCSKEEILTMYLNSVPLGNQSQGFAMASWVYFDRPITALSESELLQLVATLSSPSVNNPWAQSNQRTHAALAARFGTFVQHATTTTSLYRFNTRTAFEVASLVGEQCTSGCVTTVDHKLQEDLRSLLGEHLLSTAAQHGTHGAIVVIKVPENELLAVVGSPDPFSRDPGNQLNMATEPRPIGSTIKPFIYAEAFSLGARPYTLVDDREYKYPIGTGFSLYPKNYDGAYQGEVTLHHALANSLNTPSVKLLEYIGLHSFYTLLRDELAFEPIAPLEEYAYGIALGGLEMDLVTLTHYFTVFPNEGRMSPMYVVSGTPLKTPHATLLEERHVFDPAYTQLVTKILTDRTAGAAQFGLKSALEVVGMEVAVKTGTSRDFHDSLSVGYTPDYVVGVWIGNAENKPMRGLSGSQAAGNLWRRVMEYLRASTYNNETPFLFDRIVERDVDGAFQYGLPDDNVSIRQQVLVARNSLISTPHEGDVLLYADDMTVPLRSGRTVTWFVDGVQFGRVQELAWRPAGVGGYEITAVAGSTTERVRVQLVEEATALP